MAKILVAEDEKDIRDLIQFTLELAGHEVVVVNNGEDAVRQAQLALPDLVLLDMRMPRMTGAEACAALKADDTTRHLPIVFLSGKDADENREVAQAAGFITKPFDPAQLQVRVAEFLNQIGTA